MILIVFSSDAASKLGLLGLGKLLGLRSLSTDEVADIAQGRGEFLVKGVYKRSSVILSQSLPIYGVPDDYWAHISLNRIGRDEQQDVLIQFKHELAKRGVPSELFEEFNGEIRMVNN